ncbi:ABC transporter permease [Aminiphilus circumscriptus]|jgi:ribose transport system permease protein|uniref:ABC transporter permease n=1 Tax=Aminiphilus circumscriptus TaxID=290732 RepID=UPI000478533A|nr:ABC transporter permease [Aminiphilus circumscriptus]
MNDGTRQNPPQEAPANWIQRLKRIEFQRYAPLFALLLLGTISAFLSPYFLQVQNLVNIFRQVSYTGIIALGMTLVIISGGIDLSVGSVVAFVGALAILTVNTPAVQALGAGTAVLLACVVAVGAGFLAGAVNGLLITKGRIAPFIVTLGTMALFRSLTLYMGNAGEFSSRNALFGDFAAGSFLLLPVPVWVFLILAAFLSVLLNDTKYGRHLRAVGGNEKVALYSAIDVDRIRFFAYAINGAMVGISSALLASRFNAVSSSNTGLGFELDAIAAVIIGGTAMTGGRGTVWGTVVGAVTLGVINNMLNMVGISPYLQGTVKGLVIIAAVYIQRQKN